MNYIKKSNLRKKDPIAVLTLMFSIAPEKVNKLAATQGFEVINIEDAENLGQMVKDGDANFSVGRLVSQLKLSSKEILASKGKNKIAE